MAAYRWLALAGLLLFVLSLLMPAIDGSGFPALRGWDVLEQGASAWRQGVVAWYANPVFVVALILCWTRRFKFAFVAAVVGLLLAVSSFSAGMMAENDGQPVPAFSFAIGFYLWLFSFVAAILSAVVGLYKESGGIRPR
jgi:uncharacterized membrane protein